MRVPCLLFLAAVAAGCRPAPAPAPPPPAAASAPAAAPAPRGPVSFEGETRFANVRRLTDGGENAEAYWSWDGSRLIFQARRGDEGCDRMRIMGADGQGDTLVASSGAHTCGFFLAGDERVLFASTMSAGPDCPPPPDRSQGYVWALHPSYEIYTALPDGSDVRRLTDNAAYDAEATVSRQGRIVFTSARDGDLDIYSMNPDGTDVKRLTDEPGYDGGPVWSPDGTRIVYRARHPEDPAELADYRDLLAKHLVRPGKLEIWTMNADGGDKRQVTSLGAASFAPCFTPDGSRILFSSNARDERGRNFDLFLVGLDGTGLEQVTFNPTFDGFPLFSPDGARLAFCSNRANLAEGDTNVFVADWVATP